MKMNKHTIIVIIASIVIASPFVFAGWNIFAADKIQLVGFEQEGFTYFDMMNGGKISICNPLPFYVTFNEIDITVMFDQTSKGVLMIQDVTLPPTTLTNLQGVFTSENYEEVQYLSFTFDGMFGSGLPMMKDPNSFAIITEIQTYIMGVIPYSVTKQYSGLGFWNMMNDIDGQYNC